MEFPSSFEIEKIQQYVFKVHITPSAKRNDRIAKREYYDENVFLKADRALTKWNFLSHLKLESSLDVNL